jgi:hypothetical protein
MWLCTQSWHSMYSNTPRPQLQPFHTVNAISKPIAYSPTIYRSTSNPYTHMHAIPQNAVPRDCAHSRDIGVLKFKCTQLEPFCVPSSQTRFFPTVLPTVYTSIAKSYRHADIFIFIPLANWHPWRCVLALTTPWKTPLTTCHIINASSLAGEWIITQPASSPATTLTNTVTVHYTTIYNSHNTIQYNSNSLSPTNNEYIYPSLHPITWAEPDLSGNL